MKNRAGLGQCAICGCELKRKRNGFTKVWHSGLGTYQHTRLATYPSRECLAGDYWQGCLRPGTETAKRSGACYSSSQTCSKPLSTQWGRPVWLLRESPSWSGCQKRTVYLLCVRDLTQERPRLLSHSVPEQPAV